MAGIEMRLLLIVIVLILVAQSLCGDGTCGAGQPPLPEGSVCVFPYPNQYVAYYTGTPPIIDGNVNDEAWNEVSWTNLFVDIQGSKQPRPRFDTRAKIRWDDTYLYVATYLQEPQAWATLTERNSVIFYDNDIEVFVDPEGSTHFYKEWEMNAYNTIWDLCINQPYLNGGYENSSRVFSDGFDMINTTSNVYISGAINDPQLGTTYWTTEIAFRLEDLAYNQSRAQAPPAHGGYWRINFSRVEWQVTVVDDEYQKVPNTPEDNWLWQPTGVINVHLPERWGYIQFSVDSVNTTKLVQDPSWTVRYIAMQVYYTECSYFLEYAKYTTDTTLLAQYNEDQPHTLDGTCSKSPQISVDDDGSSFNATIISIDSCWRAMIDRTRYLQVDQFC